MRHGGAFTLAAACWCNSVQLPAPSAELSSCLQGLVTEWLPQLLADGEAEVLSGAAALAAGAARLHAEAELSWDALLAASVEKLAALVMPGSSAHTRVPLLAVRHFGAAAGGALGALGVRGARLAVAVAARGVDKKLEFPELAERALAALLLGVGGGSEAEAKSALEQLTGSLDAKSAQTLRDYASKRLKAMVQYAEEDDRAWDF